MSATSATNVALFVALQARKCDPHTFDSILLRHLLLILWRPDGIQSSAGGPGGGRTLNFETKSLRPRVRVSLNPSVVTCSNVISFPNTLVIVWSLKSQSLWSLCVCGCEGCRVHGVNTASWNQELEAGALAELGNKYIYFTTPCLLQYLQVFSRSRRSRRVFSRSRRSRRVFSISSPGLSWEL